MKTKRLSVPAAHWALLLSWVVFAAWTGVHPSDRFNWWMETLPAHGGVVVMLATYRRFRLTTVSYLLIWWFSLILATGGHYTYAHVPVGDWVRDYGGATTFDGWGTSSK
jgi:putative membrane protein